MFYQYGFNAKKVHPFLLDSLRLDSYTAEGLVHKWGLGRYVMDSAADGPSGILDSDSSVYYARELEGFKQHAYNVKYPSFLEPYLVPVSNEINTGADNYTYESFDFVGDANEIANENIDDYEVIEVKKSQTTAGIKTFGTMSSYSIQELRRSAMSRMSGITSSNNRGVAQQKAEACVKAMNMRIARIVAQGHNNGELQGFFNNTNVTTDDTTVTRNWAASGTTAEEILADFNKMMSTYRDANEDVHEPNTVLMNIATHQALRAKRLSNTNVPVLEYIQKKAYNELGLEFIAYPRVDVGVTSNKTRVIIYERDRTNLEQEIPQPIEIFAPQLLATQFRSYVRMRHGGVSLRYPLSVQRFEIGA